MGLKMLGRKVAAYAALVMLAATGTATATPLDSGSWTQVGNMSANHTGMFNGNCNLSNTCSYALDGVGDFWNTFSTFAGQQMLFISGDRKIWALADYSTISGLISAASQTFTPNIAWLDAGLNGVDLGASVVGNILMRNGVTEDPWVTLRGGHCANQNGVPDFPAANDCNLIIWGEGNFIYHVHDSLKNASGGIQVFVGSAIATDIQVPEPGTLGLLLAGALAAGFLRPPRRGA